MPLQQSRITCGNTAFTHYFLCPYYPLAAGEDLLSYSLVRFKQRLQPDLDAWISCAGKLLGDFFFAPDTIILRALRHEETTFRAEFPSALDLLGQSLARNFGCSYRPALLCKTRATLPGKYLTRGQRVSQLRDAYRLEGPSGNLINPDTPFLVIDDILTTGSTMRAIIRTLRDSLPVSPIDVFTLTRADYGAPEQPTVGRDEMPGVVKMTPGCENYTLEELKALILAKTV
jgi:predicted amidophosphoribosyltransferase